MKQSVKKLSAIIILIAISGFSQAQSMERSVIASSGNSWSGSNIQVDYTIGEMMIATVGNSGNILTQGFQQPAFLLTDAPNIQDNQTAISYYPNPCTGLLNIKIMNPASSGYIAGFFDVTGRKIFTEKINSSRDASAYLTCDISSLATGIYYVRISSGNAVAANFKIIKISNQ